MAARRAHNPKVAGSSPAPATKEGVSYYRVGVTPDSLTWFPLRCVVGYYVAFTQVGDYSGELSAHSGAVLG